MIIKKRHSGFTLLESILVIAIAGLFLVISLRQYQTYRIDADARQVQYNVDVIFQAMARFYQANCYGTSSTTGSLQQRGLLHPDNGPPSRFPVDIQTMLVDDGYLTTTIPTVVPLNPLVDSTGPGANGYVAQFNRYTQPKTVCTNTGCSITAQTGTAIFWNAQVAILLREPAKRQVYLSLLGGDCLSSLSGSIVEPCSANAPGDYVVWERSPSLASPGIQGLWTTNPTVQQFKNMYTTYPITYLISNTPQGQTPSGPQYFLCGG